MAAALRNLREIVCETTEEEAVVDKDGGPVNVDELTAEGGVVGLYFSGRWCGPCRAFTPMLVDWYQRLRPPGHHVVYVNSDENEASYNVYYRTMPWYTAGYDTHMRRELRERYNPVGRVPRLVLVAAQTGEIISEDGRAKILDDLDDSALPWQKAAF